MCKITSFFPHYDMELFTNDKVYDVVFLIGGNLGDRLENLQRAESLLAEKMKLIKSSKLYETEAWGGNSEGNFLNKALLMQTNQNPEKVLDWSLQIEEKLERLRGRRWGNRTMDIDIIYFGDLIVNSDRLVIPHPELQNRKFVLEPLMDLMPGWKDPKSGLTIQDMYRVCKDTCEVWKLPDPTGKE